MNIILEQHSNYKILPSEKLIIEYYYGEVTEDVIIDMKIRIKNDKNYNSGFNSILDFRDSVFNISSSGMTKLVNFVRDNISHDKSRKIGLLTHTPNHVVVTTLFTSHDDDLSMKYQIFSTLKATISWVTNCDNFDNKFKLIIKTIDKLRI